MKKKILILVLTDITNDARVRRQILALQSEYEVTVVCFAGPSSEHYELITLPPADLTLSRKLIVSIFLLTGLYSVAYKILHHYHSFIRSRLADRKFDLVIANDIESLPLAFALPNPCNVMFDAHEYAPKHFEDKLMWRIFFQGFNTWLCKKYIPLTSGMSTVGKGLAREYEKNFHVKPTVIMNANNYSEIGPSPVDTNRIRLVHHGIINQSRKLELMLDMMNLLDDRFSLDLFLLVPGFASQKTLRFIEEFKVRAQGDKRVKILPPIRNTEIVKTINHYDIGVFLIPPINFNYENTLPNKLFDFIQARLGIAIGPTPEMAEIVRHYNNGVVSEDFTAMALAQKLKSLTPKDIENFKLNSANAAKDFNAENSAVILQKLVKQTIDN